jgi:hypothetical protein
VALAGREGLERLGQQAAHGLPAAPSGLHQPGHTEPTEVPRDQRLGQADVLDQLRHGRVAVGEAAHDAQPIDVGQGLVEQPDGTQVVGLVDDRGDGGADPGR